jgi:hypothetical protein
MTQIGSIANGAFSCQSKILSAVFGSKCWYIGESAFEQCINLEKINDDNVIEGIGVNAFAITKLHSITFNKLESISSGVFNNCTNLTYISIPNCKTIGQSAFTNCTSLKEISFNNIQKIGDSAFISCESLDKLNLNNCKEIGAYAFKGCSNISQVSLSVCTRIGTDAFIGCTNLNRVYINNDKNTFCSLDTKKVFCKCDNDEKPVCKITFFIKHDCFQDYKNNEKWKHYIKNMVRLPGNNQIIYFTNTGKPLEVKDNVKDNYENGYENGYGLLTYINNESESDPEPEITSLNINNIFNNVSDSGASESDASDGPKLTSIIIPPMCETIEESSFEDNKSLNNIVLSDNLQHIKKYAFKNCESLTSFTIPDTISELGDGIFAGCKNIIKIDGKYTTYYNKAVVYKQKLICVLPNTESRIKISDIDNSIKILGESCFHGCKNLMRVDIPSNINKICDYAFVECTNLCEVHFEGTEPPILGKNVFEDIKDFKIFVPEESFENYRNKWSENGYNANNIYPKPKDDSIIYYSDVQINSVDESKQTHKTYTYTDENTDTITVTYHIISEVKNEVLPTNYFKQQSEIKTVILGEKITKLNESAFEGCKKLTYVYLPFNTTTMKNRCFYGCEKLSKIYMPCPPIIKTLGDDIFCKCSSLTKFNVYDKKYISDDNRCYILDDELKFFAQGDWKEGEGYTIPNNIIKINKSAFRDSLISSIEFETSTKTIGEYAFAYCKNLKSIINWDGIMTISKGAFEGCENLGKDNTIKIPKNLMSLGSFAFSGCENLNFDYTNFIGKIETINESTFYNCKKLEKFDIKNNLTVIGNSAFEGCEILEEVSTSDNLKLINEKAFKGCKSLKTFKLPNSLTTIGDSAFEGCSLYEGYVYSNDTSDNDFNININDSTIIIDKITKQTNTENTEKTLTIPTNVTSLGVACFKKSGITEMKILPSSKIKTIPNSAFESCANLKSIDISNPQITTIGSKSFYDCTNLKGELRLSNSIKKIGDYAFSGCINLKSVTLSSSLTELGNNSLSFGDSNNIFIPLYLKPPTFTTNGIRNNNSTPFGDTTYKLKDTFKIYIPPVLNKDYKNKNYYIQWDKYINYYVDDESKIENYIDAVECVIANSVHKILIIVKVGYNIPKEWYNTRIKFNIYTSDNKPIDENVEWSFDLSRYPRDYNISREVNQSTGIFMTAEKMYFKILSTKNTQTTVSKNYDGIKIDIDHVVNKNNNYIEDIIV